MNEQKYNFENLIQAQEQQINRLREEIQSKVTALEQELLEIQRDLNRERVCRKESENMLSKLRVELEDFKSIETNY